jgi:hypothetical protein
MLDVAGVALLSNKLMDIFKIVAFIRTHMLIRSRSSHRNMQYQVVQRPFVMHIGSGDPHRQRSSALIHQNMDLAARFGSIGGVIACIRASQRRWTRTTVHRLPFPQDMFLPAIKAQHRSEDRIPEAQLLPGLKAFVQNTAGDTEPIFMNGFPLAARPQDVPQAIHHGVVGFPGSAWTRRTGLFGKVLFGDPPKLRRDTKEVHLRRFYGMLFHDVPRFDLVFDKPILNQVRHFFQPALIFG